MAIDLKERERVILSVIDALGGRTSFDLIETMIRAQYRKHLRATLLLLSEHGFVLWHPPGVYALTGSGRGALQRSGGGLIAPPPLHFTAPLSSFGQDPA